MSLFKLGLITIKSVFLKKETYKYPFEKKEVSKGLKGYIKNNLNKCNLCGLCARRCPVSAINIKRKNRKWIINRFLCIQCGYCILECKQFALEMIPMCPSSATKITPEEYEIPELKGEY